VHRGAARRVRDGTGRGDRVCGSRAEPRVGYRWLRQIRRVFIALLYAVVGTSDYTARIFRSCIRPIRPSRGFPFIGNQADFSARMRHRRQVTRTLVRGIENKGGCVGDCIW